MYHGVALCGDSTMASPLHADGSTWGRAADVDGVALSRTRLKHERDYPELVRGGRARLLVLGCEVGGRWEQYQAEQASPLLRVSASMAWHRRWLGMLSIAAQTALCETLLHPESSHLTERDAAEPLLGELPPELLADAPGPSRVA